MHYGFGPDPLIIRVGMYEVFLFHPLYTCAWPKQSKDILLFKHKKLSNDGRWLRGCQFDVTKQLIAKEICECTTHQFSQSYYVELKHYHATKLWRWILTHFIAVRCVNRKHSMVKLYLPLGVAWSFAVTACILLCCTAPRLLVRSHPPRSPRSNLEVSSKTPRLETSLGNPCIQIKFLYILDVQSELVAVLAPKRTYRKS